ncbi:glutamine synthetase family protein [Telmatospirillum siberiense]|nr:glutamine synthetase family protein [Telmatospirillum siberiense]
MAEHPEIEVLEAFIIDVNGVTRGKWIPRDRADEILTKGLALPRSVLALDIWGRDVEAAGLAEGTGDPDGICMPVPGTLAPVPWLERPTAQVMLTMMESPDKPFFADPRAILAAVLRRFSESGLTPVVAAELEFYLIDPHRSATDPVRPPNSRSGRWQGWQTQVLSIAELHEFENLLSDISRVCTLQGVPADAILRENGPGQYEINLKHVGDAMKAADHAVMLKRVVKGIAHQHGLDATFMAKPYGDRAGSGMHVHFSLLDGRGRNVFSSDDGRGSDVMRHAVGGLVRTMGESMAVFAPHANSYRRLTHSEHAPLYASWGYDNRNAAVRLITTSGPATRIEHRVSGADANPYLAIATMLAGAHYGIANQIEPGAQMVSDDDEEFERLSCNWDDGIEAFAESEFVSQYLGDDYQKLYAACKTQELNEFRLRVTDVEYDAYLRNV